MKRVQDADPFASNFADGPRLIGFLINCNHK